MGVMPHFGMLIVVVCYVLTLSIVRFAAKRDAQGVEVLRKNSRFLMGRRFYMARGFAGHVAKLPRVVSVPLSRLQKL